MQVSECKHADLRTLFTSGADEIGKSLERMMDIKCDIHGNDWKCANTAVHFYVNMWSYDTYPFSARCQMHRPRHIPWTSKLISAEVYVCHTVLDM